MVLPVIGEHQHGSFHILHAIWRLWEQFVGPICAWMEWKKMTSKSEVVKKVKSTFFFTIFGRFEMPWCVVLIPDWDESCCQTWRTKSSQSGMTKMTVTRQTMLNKMWQSLKVSMCNVHQLCTSKKQQGKVGMFHCLKVIPVWDDMHVMPKTMWKVDNPIHWAK